MLAAIQIVIGLCVIAGLAFVGAVIYYALRPSAESAKKPVADDGDDAVDDGDVDDGDVDDDADDGAGDDGADDGAGDGDDGADDGAGDGDDGTGDDGAGDTSTGTTGGTSTGTTGGTSTGTTGGTADVHPPIGGTTVDNNLPTPLPPPPVPPPTVDAILVPAADPSVGSGSGTSVESLPMTPEEQEQEQPLGAAVGDIINMGSTGGSSSAPALSAPQAKITSLGTPLTVIPAISSFIARFGRQGGRAGLRK